MYVDQKNTTVLSVVKKNTNNNDTCNTNNDCKVNNYNRQFSPAVCNVFAHSEYHWSLIFKQFSQYSEGWHHEQG